MDNQDKYEEESSTQMNEGSSSHGKTSFKDAKPDEIKERVKETVQKGVAAVAGALKGFSEEAKKDELAQSTKQAIQKAGETTREVAGTVKSEVRETKSTLKGGQSSMGSGTSMGSSSYGSASYGSTGLGDVGSTGGTTSTGTKDVPDLRKTDIAKSDDELDKNE
jgi:hypothetical protein